MLEESKDVIAAYPHGDTGDVEIHVSKAGVYTKASVTELIESDDDFTVRSFSKRSVTNEDDKTQNSKPATKKATRARVPGKPVGDG